jgi:hypothetical protein
MTLCPAHQHWVQHTRVFCRPHERQYLKRRIIRRIIPGLSPLQSQPGRTTVRDVVSNDAQTVVDRLRGRQ